MNAQNKKVDSTSGERVVNNVMRHEYRVLSDAEKEQMKALKDKGREFVEFCDSIGKSRELSLAVTKMEEAVMWGVKLVEHPQGLTMAPMEPERWHPPRRNKMVGYFNQYRRTIMSEIKVVIHDIEAFAKKLIAELKDALDLDNNKDISADGVESTVNRVIGEHTTQVQTVGESSIPGSAADSTTGSASQGSTADNTAASSPQGAQAGDTLAGTGGADTGAAT